MALGRAKIAMSDGLSVWVLDAPDGFGDADFHAHHAIQITVVLAGRLTLATADTVLQGPAIAVAADATHRFQASGLLAFVFVEPESRWGRALSEACAGRDMMALDAAPLLRALAPLARTFDEALTPAALIAAGRAAVDAVVPTVEPAMPDPRIARVIDHVAHHAATSLDAAARAAGVFLSPSRLRHLFVEQTGLPFKTFMLWQRLTRAIDAYAEGHSLTEAAHGAGFSDSAHFSRVFRRTFGLPATTLTRL
ncbi:MAG: AraC family transcriptional regulator [Sphingomonas sp.]